MKAPLRFFIATALVFTVFIAGCITGNKAATAPRELTSPEEFEVPQTDADPMEALKPPESTPTTGPDSSPSFKQASSPAAPPVPELRQKDEINAAALQFAKEVPNVKHVKTCFSTVYGGWYLLLYIEKNKVVSLQQYSWDPRTKEWDFVYQLKELPSKQVEHHLKGEVGDEKCFILKK